MLHLSKISFREVDSRLVDGVTVVERTTARWGPVVRRRAREFWAEHRARRSISAPEFGEQLCEDLALVVASPGGMLTG